MIIDGNSIANRAFYGIRMLTNKDGLPTMIEFEIDNEYTPYDLLQITLNEHDNLNKEKVLVI